MVRAVMEAIMNIYWVVLAAAFVLAFAIGETYAFDHPNRQNTLSRSVALLGARWPFSIWLIGVLVGVLAAHFFWPWCGNPLGAGVG
jgi:hypothetical protein